MGLFFKGIILKIISIVAERSKDYAMRILESFKCQDDNILRISIQDQEGSSIRVGGQLDSGEF